MAVDLGAADLRAADLRAVESGAVYLGFDPGSAKCGLAVLRSSGEILAHEVVRSDGAIEQLRQWQQQYQATAIIMGDQTTSKAWVSRLEQGWPDAPPIQRVDERYSTLAARDRYWELYPPRGWRKLLPRGLRQPPRPVDDIAAIVLVERFLANSSPKN
ncbi:Holliday junction resolvase RuvX [Limnothrix sp. FACHB-708]|uniref:Holliday junction resolvase RuvX n=1 Tax=unclassified Limnothrix TaxID=2632864 RepID=UPI000C147717|nr:MULTISPECIES: Holliday junction resolvase RuvX [unclassified Limnothrix]MBD2161304.1 Holliday junction resolvase RuvX [Limnothrix sp. FACHB-1083]MBD2192184.1 Holliday junction resolvase RuvX [Limnothrix sp. FACHB-1088]MBD2554737.1 Holliday junction resolvase RuvX [Limnothrix sp. FACHB-708]MBD2591944.1 Holliday junction resolvase RuvX [Limnothrix sp. FACHB-406]